MSTDGEADGIPVFIQSAFNSGVLKCSIGNITFTCHIVRRSQTLTELKKQFSFSKLSQFPVNRAPVYSKGGEVLPKKDR